MKLPLAYVQEQLTKQREYWQQALTDPLISLQQWAMTLKELYLYDCQPSGAEAARLEAFCFE
ncbi:hypothetical protein [uncultured Shewanella sp.]|uniref:hypothetical protein n=1 Tax=uncultured Shewanella sp. TaxID=173975 RepID=UPI00260E2030|nr:hypothetical protein [uncultured Shewanella sp.]